MRFNAALARRVALILGLSFPAFSNALAEGRAVLPPKWMVEAYLSDALVKPSRDDIARAIIPGLGMVPAFLGQGLSGPPGTVFLCHCDGTNGSTSFVDSSGLGVPITKTGSVSISTSSPKFGTGSVEVISTTPPNQLVATSSDFNFPGDFTIAFWVKSTWGADYSALLNLTQGSYSTTGNLWIAINYNSGMSSGSLSLWNHSAQLTGASSTGWNNGSWHHIAVTRSGSSLRLFVDGVQKGSTVTNSSTFGVAANTLCFGIGSGFGGGGWPEFNVDEILVVKGSALWTGTFTPPTAAY